MPTFSMSSYRSCFHFPSSSLHTLESKHDWGTPLRTLRTFLRTLIHFFFIFLWFVLDLSFFFMENEIIVFQILYKHIKYLLFSLLKVKIIKFIQCGPYFINGPKFPEISFLKTFYITIGHLVFVTFIHFMCINT